MKRAWILGLAVLTAGGCSLISANAPGASTPPLGTTSGSDSSSDDIDSLQKDEDIFVKAIQPLENPTDGDPGRNDIAFARTDLMTFLGDLEKGTARMGECKSCKLRPDYAKLKDDFAGLEQRMEKVEATYLKCTFGYKISGKIVKPDANWSDDQFQDMNAKAEGGNTPRCWDNKDPKHYND